MCYSHPPFLPPAPPKKYKIQNTKYKIHVMVHS